MKRIALASFIVIAACGRPTPTLGPVTTAPVTMTFAGAPAVGTRTTETLDYTMDFSLQVSVGGNSVNRHMKGGGHSTRTEEVLTVSNDAITKLRVVYVDDTSNVAADDGEPTTRAPDPRTGHSYVVDTTGGLHVETSDDSEESKKRVLREFAWLGKSQALEFSGPKTFNPGDHVNDLLESKLRLEAERSGVYIDTADVQFRGRHDDEAVFDLDFKAQKSFELGSVSLSLKGQLGLCVADGRACDFTGAGELLMDAQKGEASLHGDGIFEGRVHREPTR